LLAVDDDRSPLTALEAPLPEARTPVTTREADLPPLVLAPEPDLAPDPDLEAATAPSALEPDPATAHQATTGLSTLDVQPAPHRARPEEMWHPPVLSTPVAEAPVAVAPEVHLHAADLVEPEADAPSPRFSFGRLRAVLPVESTPVPGPSAAGSPALDEARPSLLEELCAPYGTDPEPAAPVDHVEPPLVPGASPVGGALIDGPVSRRVDDDAEIATARDHAGSRDLAGSHEFAAPAVEPAPPVVVAAGPVLAPWTEPAPAVEPAVVREELWVGVDGLVALDGGHVRFARDVHTAVERVGDRIELALPAGWCWTALGADATATVSVALPAGALVVPQGTMALAVVEPDGSTFVVVVDGEAVLEHPGGSVELRPGAMALVPAGAGVEVDEATPEEVTSDPIVRVNLDLDADLTAQG
ncbi:MAG TPA: hypothetical protein VHK88_05575, partial [Aquihabitans sp.]|nr:hypothetical protein [Aquihabitans sp.]